MIQENGTSSSKLNINTSAGVQVDSDTLLVNVSNMLGYKIVKKNKIMGNIKDIVFSVTRGYISYVILSSDLFLSINRKLMPKLVNALKFDVERKHFLLNIGKEVLTTQYC